MTDEQNRPAVGVPLDGPVGLVQRLQDEADLCRNDGADDIAGLLDEAAGEVERLRMLTCECVRNSADAARYRWLRDVGDASWSAMAARVTEGAKGIDAAIDAAIAAAREHNARANRPVEAGGRNGSELSE